MEGVGEVLLNCMLKLVEAVLPDYMMKLEGEVVEVALQQCAVEDEVKRMVVFLPLKWSVHSCEVVVEEGAQQVQMIWLQSTVGMAAHWKLSWQKVGEEVIVLGQFGLPGKQQYVQYDGNEVAAVVASPTQKNHVKSVGADGLDELQDALAEHAAL